MASQQSPQFYARVIIPMPIEGAFTYLVPPHLADTARAGLRVLVPFGPRHLYTGVIEEVTTIAPPQGVKLKEISMILDEHPIVRQPQIRFWHWLADYYLCTVGDVFKAALPSGLKIESETRIQINPDALPEDFAKADDREAEILGIVLSEGSCTVQTVEKKLEGAKAGSIISRLIDKGLVSVAEKVTERYRSVRKPYVRPTIERGNPSSMSAAFALLSRSPRQENTLVALLALSEFNRSDMPLAEVPLDVLCERADTTRGIVKALEAKGVCEIYNKEISRFSYSGPPACPKPELSDHQARALRQIHHQFREKDIVLLHGVTGSGKTEIYIHLIDFVLEQGRQALFLVPEIALTTQLTRRLQRVFGDKVMIYHSKFSDNERVELWRSMLQSNAPRVVIGARSAVFLPFSDLGLVIVDEEHETSYKQFDPAPRYNARDAATVLASMHGAKTLFGSATPTVETYHKALSGKFGLVELSERFSGARLPAIEIVDMKRERGRKAVAGYFSHRLLDLTNESLGRNNQTILFHNRRGYAPMARCKLCGFTPKCNFCDVSLTYHRRFNRLQCHYCGTDYSVQQLCPECHEPTMEIVGYGTERLEEELAESFPQRKILRMDLDTTRNKDSYGKIIDDFSQHKADILVGTQMVTKGLDFDSVEIVGILNADSLINYPDFRAAERAFNMIEQVAGRAGRRNVEGRVIIQTYNPAHPILSYAASHDYKGFFEHELEERRAFSFPPFSKIINIYLRHRDQHTVNECATLFATSLRNIFGSRISGPIEPDVARVSSMYIRKIMLKIETNASMKRVKEILRDEYVRISASPVMRGLSVHYDVDPV